MRFLLLLFLAAPLSAGGFLMDSQAKAESLTILSELETDLNLLKEALKKATDNATRLDEDLRLSLLKLANSEKLLHEVKLNLEASEASLTVVQNLLTQASQALEDSERSLKDFQRWELIKIGVAVVVGVVVGLVF